MKKSILAILVGAFLLGGTGVAHAGWLSDLLSSPPSAPSATGQQRAEQRSVAENQQIMETAVGLPQLQSSLERANIKRRLELFSDESKVSYIYLISFGKVMTFYTVKGKITSGGKRLTATERLVDGGGSYEQNNLIVESPELDGTYGSSAPYIFFWTTDGVYVQWNGEYMLADQPLKLTTQPELVRQIN